MLPCLLFFFFLFRCAVASLYEVVSVRPSVRPNVPCYFWRWKERILSASFAVYPALLSHFLLFVLPLWRSNLEDLSGSSFFPPSFTSQAQSQKSAKRPVTAWWEMSVCVRALAVTYDSPFEILACVRGRFTPFFSTHGCCRDVREFLVQVDITDYHSPAFISISRMKR